jgi:hypothetical protein
MTSQAGVTGCGAIVDHVHSSYYTQQCFVIIFPLILDAFIFTEEQR